MEKEDKTIVKSMLFTASLVFSVLAFCVLIGITIDYNEIAAAGGMLNGANLKPLLVVFYVLIVIIIATIVTSYILTFVDSEKSGMWKNRLILCSIVLITLTVAIYAIMQFSSYISLSEIKKALDSVSVEPFARKYYTSKMATVMMFATISLLVNMFILKVKNALLSTSQATHEPVSEPSNDNNEEELLTREIADMKSKIRLQNLIEEKAKLQNELHTYNSELQGEQMSIENFVSSDSSEPTNAQTEPDKTLDGAANSAVAEHNEQN